MEFVKGRSEMTGFFRQNSPGQPVRGNIWYSGSVLLLSLEEIRNLQGLLLHIASDIHRSLDALHLGLLCRIVRTRLQRCPPRLHTTLSLGRPSPLHIGDRCFVCIPHPGLRSTILHIC